MRQTDSFFSRALFAVTLAALAVTPLSAQDKSVDWPQFRGPSGMGVSGAKGLPVSWSQSENVIAKTELPGAGTSSPIVVGSKIYLTCYSGFNIPGQEGAMDDLKLHLVCLNRDDCSIAWTSDVVPKLPEQAKIRDDHGYASSTPACDGERIYVFFGKTGVFAFDLSGKKLWEADVGDELNGWGTAASPVLFGDLVIINASVESQSLVALNKLTGKEVWRFEGIKESWNTPVLVPVEGGKTELVVGIFGKVLGIDPATGEQLWSCNNDITWYVVPSIVAADGIVWSIGGRSGVAGIAVRAGGRGDVTKSHRLWTIRQGSNVSSPIIHEGHLYWMNDSMGIAYCADAKTGEVVYQERLNRAGQFYSSPVLADGKLYYVSRQGRVFVIAAQPKFELLATNDLSDRSTFNACPAISGDRILVRSDKYLYALGNK